MKSISNLHSETVACIDAIIDDEVKRIEGTDITYESIMKSVYEIITAPPRKCVPVKIYDHISGTWYEVMM